MGLVLLLPVFFSLVSADADADAYYSEGYFGTVYQGPYAYKASTPTHTHVVPKDSIPHGHTHSHTAYVAPVSSYEPAPVYNAYSAPVATYNAYSAPVATHNAYSAPVVPSYVSHSNYGSTEAVVVDDPAYESSAPSLTSSQYHSQDEAGNFAFGYNNVNGAREESGNVETGVSGSYTGADGQIVRYVADNYGFRLV